MTAPTRTLLAAGALVLLASACGGGSSSNDAHASAPTAPGQQRINDGGTFDARGHSTVDVTATNFRFSPSTILGTPGEKLTLVVRNTSQTPHNIVAPGVDQDLAPGSVQRVTLTVPANGELVFVCEYHKASGMAGQVGTSAPTSAGTPTAPSTGGAGGDYRY
jgi:plastocyanin